MDVRRLVSGLGRVLVALGVVLLLFVAYQLWGTGLSEARSQAALRREFRRQLPAPTSTTTPPTTTPEATAPTVPPTQVPPAPDGEAVAIIGIPRIGVEKAVVEGVGVAELKKGPGHYPRTPLPGQPGNAAIAGHRTTYGAPFYRLDELVAGDPVLVTTRAGRFRYEVTETRVVRPNETSVVGPTADNRLTLTTCEPRFSASRRLVVVAALTGDAVALPAPPPAPAQPPSPTDPAAGPTTSSPDAPAESENPTPAESEDDEGAGLDTELSGDPSARAPSLAWGTAVAVVAWAIWWESRRWRRWPAYLLGAPVLVVVLFVFFEHLNRLLPANL